MPPNPIPNAMVLATVDDRGYPSARVVLCKEIDAAAGLHHFLHQLSIAQGTGTRSPIAGPRWYFIGIIATGRCAPRGGRIARRTPRTTPIFAPERGRAASAPGPASKAEPVESRQALARSGGRRGAPLRHSLRRARRSGTRECRRGVPRPPHWGGFRLNPEAVELWVEGEFRIHDRARWTRTLPDRSIAGSDTPWSVTRLQP